MRHCFILLGITVGCVCAPRAYAQQDLPVEPDHSWPYAGARALATVDDSGVELVFAGSGSGIRVYDTADPDNLALWTGPSNDLRSAGFIRDICVTDAHVFAAADRVGLVAFDRTNYSQTVPLNGLSAG